MAPVETEYYELVRTIVSMDSNYLVYFDSTQLGVAVDADDTELKKAYRKQAIKVSGFATVSGTRSHISHFIVPSRQEPLRRRRREVQGYQVPTRSCCASAC